MKFISAIKTAACLLLFILITSPLLSQDNFFSVRSRKKKIEIVNAWSQETMAFIQTKEYRQSDEYSLINNAAPNSDFMIGFKNDRFSKYFGKPFAALNPSEMEEIVFVMFDRNDKAARDLNVNTNLSIPLLSDVAITQHFSPGTMSARAVQRARKLINEINSTASDLPPLKGRPIVAGKEPVTATCLGMKVVEANFEGEEGTNRRFLVTDIQLGGPAYLAGLQPGDLFISLGSDQIQSVSEFRDLGCTNTKLVTITYSMIYKNPNQEGYLPFTGSIEQTPTKSAGPWANTVTGNFKPGSSWQAYTQYDEHGQKASKEKRIKVISYGRNIWPDRTQFEGIADTIKHYIDSYNAKNDIYKAKLAALKADAANLPCLYNEASVEYLKLLEIAQEIDNYLATYIGGSYNNTADEIKRFLNKNDRCANEWWNLPGNRMTPVVRDLLANDERTWVKHKPTEMNPDNWNKWINLLFTSFEKRYNATCLNQNPEPIDTFFLHVEGTPDAVWLNRWGIQVMRVPGRQEQTYYYYARKKYALAYKASFNYQQSQGSALAQWLALDVNAYQDLSTYISAIINKYGCQSAEVRQLEQQLFKGILFLWPENREEYMAQYKKWNGKK